MSNGEISRLNKIAYCKLRSTCDWNLMNSTKKNVTKLLWNFVITCTFARPCCLHYVMCEIRILCLAILLPRAVCVLNKSCIFVFTLLPDSLLLSFSVGRDGSTEQEENVISYDIMSSYQSCNGPNSFAQKSGRTHSSIVSQTDPRIKYRNPPHLFLMIHCTYSIRSSIVFCWYLNWCICMMYV